MTNLVMLAALLAPGQYPYEEINRLICDRINYGGYGTYGGCPSTYACRGIGPCAGYAGGCYGPAVVALASARDPHADDHKEIHKELDAIHCSIDKLTHSLLNLEKRVAKNEKANADRFKAIEDKLKKQKKQIKKVDERGKKTEMGLAGLAKKIEDEARAREIKALEDKVRKLEEAAKTQQLEERLGSTDRLKALENRLGQIEGNERKRDEAVIQFIDQKMDKLQSTLKRDIDGIHDHLRRVDDQLRDEKDFRRQIMERLRAVEKNVGVPPMPKEFFIPKKEKKEKVQDDTDKLPEPKDSQDVRAKSPTMTLAARSEPSADVPANKALLVVSLPADARLYLNGKLTKSTGSLRTFFTPAIEAGADFAYTVRVELVRNGQTTVSDKQIVFRAGSQVQMTFEQPGLQTAAR